MDTQPLSFTGKLTLQDALDLNRYRSLCVLRRSMRWLITIFSALLAATIIFLIVHRQYNLQLIIILILCVYVPVAVWYRRDFAVRKQYRRHPEYYIENTVTVDEKSVSISNVNLDMRLNWNQISFLLDTPRGLMFVLPSTNVLCWLPQRLFDGNNFKEAMLGYATKNKVPVRTMDMPKWQPEENSYTGSESLI